MLSKHDTSRQLKRATVPTFHSSLRAPTNPLGHLSLHSPSHGNFWFASCWLLTCCILYLLLAGQSLNLEIRWYIGVCWWFSYISSAKTRDTTSPRHNVRIFQIRTRKCLSVTFSILKNEMVFVNKQCSGSTCAHFHMLLFIFHEYCIYFLVCFFCLALIFLCSSLYPFPTTFLFDRLFYSSTLCPS